MAGRPVRSRQAPERLGNPVAHDGNKLVRSEDDNDVADAKAAGKKPAAAAKGAAKGSASAGPKATPTATPKEASKATAKVTPKANTKRKQGEAELEDETDISAQPPKKRGRNQSTQVEASPSPSTTIKAATKSRKATAKAAAEAKRGGKLIIHGPKKLNTTTTKAGPGDKQDPKSKKPGPKPKVTNPKPAPAKPRAAATKSKPAATNPRSKAAKPGRSTQVGRRYQGPRELTFKFVHMNPKLPQTRTNKNILLFYSSGTHYGGPLAFLSNFWKSEFYDPEMNLDHTFTSMEQYYQYAKCKTFTNCAIKYNNWSPRIPSNVMHHCILMLDRPMHIMQAGRSYKDAARRDPNWAATWLPGWQQIVSFVLKRGLAHKFDQNDELRSRLLKTGDYMLVEASSDDHACGIGFNAQNAMKNVKDWGENMLGKMLMEVREHYKQAEGYTGGYDKAFWDAELQKHAALFSIEHDDLEYTTPSKADGIQASRMKRTVH